jgi:hypothetical protein
VINDADVIEFQRLYEKRFGKSIDHDEAYKQLSLLVRQMQIVYQPITQAQYEEYVNRYEDVNEETQPAAERPTDIN